jgi:hypothetical protein
MAILSLSIDRQEDKKCGSKSGEEAFAHCSLRVHCLQSLPPREMTCRTVTAILAVLSTAHCATLAAPIDLGGFDHHHHKTKAYAQAIVWIPDVVARTVFPSPTGKKALLRIPAVT